MIQGLSKVRYETEKWKSNISFGNHSLPNLGVFSPLLAGKSENLAQESRNFLSIRHYYPLNLHDFYKPPNIGLVEAEPPLFVLKMLSPVKFGGIFSGVDRNVKFTIGKSLRPPLGDGGLR